MSSDPADGLLLVDKPAGCTSHDVVGRVRAVLGTRRVGHAGTLDPMATGLLVLAVERSTRLLGRLALVGKTYQATIRLGSSTSTDDAWGDPTGGTDPGAITDDDIAAGIAALTGDISQVPSTVSAIKVDGRRAYELARAGEQVELAARPVRVTRFELVGAVRRAQGVIDLDVEVDCSTGTYIRALARDLGAGLAVGGHLTALRRTAVGPFRIDRAVDVYGPAGVPERGGPRVPIDPDLRAAVESAVIPAALAAGECFPTRSATSDEQAALSYGQSLVATGTPEVTAVLDAAGSTLLALVQDEDGRAKPITVFAAR